MTLLKPMLVLLQTSSRIPSFSTCRTAYPTTISIRPTNHNRHQQRRNFITNPLTSNQTLLASRTLHYPTSVIYSVISDVSSYSQFVPYCQQSIVTKTSHPARDGKSYPEEARLTIGFNEDISQEFTSRVYCVPGRVVEAVSGRTEASVSGDEIQHHTARPPVDQDPSRQDTVMARLLTRWTLRPFPYKPGPNSAQHPNTAHKNLEETNPTSSQEMTEVNLAIEFQFSNPLYSALSSAAAPKVAEKMIEAFQNRIKAIVEGPG